MGELVRNPVVQVVLVLLICVVVASLSVASAISGALTAAAVSGAGLISLVIIIFVLKSGVGS